MGRKRVYPRVSENLSCPERKFWFKQKQHSVGKWLCFMLQGGHFIWGWHSSPWDQPERELPIPNDFALLTACFLSDLVPVGVWTDRFEELFPEQTEVVEFLRRWEERKREIDSYQQ